MLVKCVLLLLCYHLPLGGVVSEFIPTVYPAKIVSSSQCGQQYHFHDKQPKRLVYVSEKRKVPGSNLVDVRILIFSWVQASF